MHIPKNLVAKWLHSRLVSIELESPETIDPAAPCIGLTLTFKDHVPDTLLLDLHLDLMIEIAIWDEKAGAMRMEDQHISFYVADTLISGYEPPSCRLELRPDRRVKTLDTDHRSAFLILVDEASRQARDPDGWRHQVARICFYHPGHRERQEVVENPDYKPVACALITSIWDAIPKAMQRPDTDSIKDYMHRIDVAFEDDAPPIESLRTPTEEISDDDIIDIAFIEMPSGPDGIDVEESDIQETLLANTGS